MKTEKKCPNSTEMDACSGFDSQQNRFHYGDEYSDIIIRVQNTKFPCHRDVLTDASDYFKAMFSGCFIEETAQVITLHDMDAETFQEIVTSVYEARECKVTVNNVFSLLRAASFLSILIVEKSCVKFLLENFSKIRDLIDLFALVCAINNITLIHALSVYIVHNFESLYNDEKLIELQFDNLKFILHNWQNDGIPFKRENLLLDLLIRWVHRAPESRRKYFEEFVNVINFERISAQYITFMLKYFENFETSTENVACMIEENKSNCDSTVKKEKWCSIQDSKSRLSLQRKISEYFATNKKFSDNGKDVISVPTQNPAFLKNELGFHIYVEFERISDCFNFQGYGVGSEMLKNAKILSMHKYRPDWFVLCQTNAWSRCNGRHIVPQIPLGSAELLYCFEIFEDKCERSRGDFRETFYAYPSIDLKLASSVLTPPPISLRDRQFNTCALQNDIYLQVSEGYRYGGYWGTLQPLAGSTFSKEEIQGGLCRYNCEVDKWFPVPERRKEQRYSCLAVDSNLLYTIGNETFMHNSVQAFDQRTAEWMILPNSSLFHYPSISQCCTLNDKVYVFQNGGRIEIFDTKAQKWEFLKIPDLSRQRFCTFSKGSTTPKKFMAYENMLWLIAESNWYTEVKDSVAMYNFISQEWHFSESLSVAIYNSMPKKIDHCTFNWCIRDIIICKS